MGLLGCVVMMALTTPSDRFEVTAAGRPLAVEAFHDVSYARFTLAAAAPAPVEIHFKSKVRSARAIPASAVEGLTTGGNAIRFTLRRPANVAVLVNQDQRLFLFADPPETEVPGPNALDVVERGADPTGKTPSTTALQKTIDAAATSGGTVLVPAGLFVTGTLVMRSRVTLYLASGAVLRGSGDPADYPKDPGRHETGSDESIQSADQRYQGQTMTFSRLILFDGAEAARIIGRGTIDGNGSHLRRERNAVPNLIRIRRGRRISIKDVLLRDAAAWTVHVLAARDVHLDNVKILNDRANLNTDGVDVDSSQDVSVRGSFIHTKDDAVCVKATNNSDLLADVERVEVTGNVLSSTDAAMKVGTESQAAHFRDIQFRDNDVFDTGRAMSVVVRDGAAYARIAFRDIRVGPGVTHLVEQVIGVRSGRKKALGTVERLTFENVDAPFYERPASNWTWYAQFRPDAPAMYGDVPVFRGADATHAVRGLTLRNITVGGARLTDRAAAERVANLTIGPFVEGVVIE
ncbi:MAG TPA: glycosyl hydrolase family 28 protein [Myxococcaceae bacterium]|nr:glycosyl hydrolase family 28 protein [Myxococcaceae bacterium]